MAPIRLGELHLLVTELLRELGAQKIEIGLDLGCPLKLRL